jgi:glycosyltransferase involved in cell wall biosynthesis
MITVLSVIDTGGPGGAETVYLDTCTGLDPQRIRSVSVISRDGWLAASMRKRGHEPLIVPSSGSLNFGYLRQLLRIARAVRADLLVGHLYGSAVYCGMAGALLRLPVISVLHGQSDISREGRFSELKKLIVRNTANKLVFVSDRLRDELMPILGARAARCAVIPNGVDLSRFENGTQWPLRAELGVQHGEVLIGAVGNIRAPKSYDVLLRAVHALKKRGVRFRLAIAGEGSGSLFDQLLALRRELDLEREVTFLGLRSDVAAIMASLDVYVLSSTTEGFSIACIEALAAGTPVVATRSGGPQEIIEHEHSGVLVPVQDPSALAAAIERIVNDPSLAGRLKVNGLARVKSRYTLQAMLAAYEQLFLNTAHH